MGEDEDGRVVRLRAKGRGPCPICGRPQVAQYRPFCSKRCADVDLGRWLGGNYRIASDERPEEPAGEEGEG